MVDAFKFFKLSGQEMRVGIDDKQGSGGGNWFGEKRIPRDFMRLKSKS